MYYVYVPTLFPFLYCAHRWRPGQAQWRVGWRRQHTGAVPLWWGSVRAMPRAACYLSTGGAWSLYGKTLVSRWSKRCNNILRPRNNTAGELFHTTIVNTLISYDWLYMSVWFQGNKWAPVILHWQVIWDYLVMLKSPNKQFLNVAVSHPSFFKWMAIYNWCQICETSYMDWKYSDDRI